MNDYTCPGCGLGVIPQFKRRRRGAIKTVWVHETEGTPICGGAKYRTEVKEKVYTPNMKDYVVDKNGSIRRVRPKGV